MINNSVLHLKIMNKEIEEEFVRTFVTKDKRSRALYLLSKDENDTKYRAELLYKMSFIHIWFKEHCITKISVPIPTNQTVLDILKAKGASERCYAITPYHEETDGTEMLLADALDVVVGYGPAIIYCKPKKLAYFEDEQSYGAPDRYVLLAE